VFCRPRLSPAPPSPAAPTRAYFYHMAHPPTTHEEAEANWAVDRVTGLPEVWALVAAHLGLVGAWRQMRVCKAARVGAKEFLSTLPGLVVCGGFSQGEGVRDDAWMLDLATLRWEPMPALVTARSHHACCAVRGKLVVLGGVTTATGSRTSSVEMFSSEKGAFVALECGGISSAAAIAVDESDSAAGQVLLLGGLMQKVLQCRRCTWSIWPPACAHPASLTCSARAGFLRPLGCQVGASCAREASVSLRRGCGGRRCRERRTQRGAEDICPRWVLGVTAAADA
jgi:hypothetical protein